MSVLTVAEAQGFLASSTLSAASLQLAIDDVESEIVRRYGPYYPTPHVELFLDAPETGPLVLRRRLAEITEIVETLGAFGPPETRILATTDYRFRAPFLLDRLRTGPTPAYGWSRYGVSVSGIPTDDTSTRKMAVVDVLRIEVSGQAAGLTSRRMGEYAETFGGGGSNGASDDVSTTRAKILRSRLRPKAFVLR